MSCIVTAIIITKNEELHIGRCIDSIKKHVSKIVIVDSGSVDRTKDIALSKGCEFYFNKWVGYSSQVNWAINKVSDSSDWILRIDADEVINDGKITVKEFLSQVNSNINGLNIKRDIFFAEEIVRYGGVHNKKILRIIRSGFGRCDNKIMDEHLISSDIIIDSPFIFSDISLIEFKEFVCKHIDYANLEVMRRVENVKKEPEQFKYAKDTVFRKFLRENIFYKLPSKLRPFLYYLYRLFIRGGIFDTNGGFYYHLFQGLMYRSFVEYIYYGKFKKRKYKENIS